VNNAEATGVVGAVQRDHREIEQMLDNVESSSGAKRQDAFARLAEKLQAHEAAEEKVVHPLAKDEGNAGTVDELVGEEQTASKALEKLQGLDVDSEAFEQAFQQLKRDVLAHAEQEERDEHPRLLEETPADELERREGMFEREERSAGGH
jgi:hemerythrin superfamily protein